MTPVEHDGLTYFPLKNADGCNGCLQTVNSSGCKALRYSISIQLNRTEGQICRDGDTKFIWRPDEKAKFEYITQRLTP